MQPRLKPAVHDSAFSKDARDFFACRRSGHMGTWRYSEPLFEGDPVNGAGHWSAFVKHAKATGTYYIVNDELNAINKALPRVLDILPDRMTLIDMGPGSKEAVREKIGPLLNSGRFSGYVGMDICNAVLSNTRAVIENEFSDISFYGLHCDFYKDALRFPVSGMPVMAMFGQTLFNLPIDPFDKPLADRILFERLVGLKRYLGGQGYFIITQDCNQDAQSLYNAYAPEADFNLNLLHRIQRDLPVGTAYSPDNFSFEPRWISETEALSHTYVSRKQMAFTVDNETFYVRAGQRFYLHNTYKYSLERFARLAIRAGFKNLHTEISDSGRLALHVLRAD